MRMGVGNGGTGVGGVVRGEVRWGVLITRGNTMLVAYVWQQPALHAAIR